MAIVLGIVSTTVAVGLLLVVRRLLGGLVEPLPIGPMVLVATLSTALAACGRTAWQRTFFRDTRPQVQRLGLLVGWGSSLGLVLLAVGCCWPAEQLSDSLIWLPLLVADQFWRQSFFDGGKPTAGPAVSANPPMAAIGIMETKVEAFALTPECADPECGEQVVQQLYRVRGADGHETVYGTLQAEFAPGQRTTAVYVGFCPPLPQRPQVEAEPLSGPEATVKVVQSLPHGARLDVRLAAPATEPATVAVDFAALPAGAFDELETDTPPQTSECPPTQKAAG